MDGSSKCWWNYSALLPADQQSLFRNTSLVEYGWGYRFNIKKVAQDMPMSPVCCYGIIVRKIVCSLTKIITNYRKYNKNTCKQYIYKYLLWKIPFLPCLDRIHRLWDGQLPDAEYITLISVQVLYTRQSLAKKPWLKITAGVSYDHSKRILIYHPARWNAHIRWLTDNVPLWTYMQSSLQE